MWLELVMQRSSLSSVFLTDGLMSKVTMQTNISQSTVSYPMPSIDEHVLKFLELKVFGECPIAGSCIVQISGSYRTYAVKIWILDSAVLADT